MFDRLIGSTGGESGEKSPTDRGDLPRKAATLLILVVLFPGLPAVAGGDARTGGTAASATTTSATTAISGCTTINEPGSYRLTQDIIDTDNNACIHINTSDVVFDGGGHTVDGWQFNNAYGIWVENTTSVTKRTSNVTVRNVVVSDWDSNGIYYKRSDDGLIANVTALNSSSGIAIEGRNVTVRDSVVKRNDNGISVSNPLDNGSTIEDTLVVNNSATGIAAGLSTTLRNNTVADNGDVGIRVDQDSVLINNTVMNNGLWDVSANAVPGGDVKYVTVRNLDIGASTAPHTTLDFVARDVKLRGVSSPPADPTDERNISRYVEVNRSAVTGAYLNVTFEYADADVSGLSESTLDIWKYDGSWTELGSGPGTDLAANEIQCNVTSFSTFGVFGRTSTATPTPTATTTSTPTATATSTPAPTATATPMPTATPVPTATPTPAPTATATPTAEPTATATPTAEPTETVAESPGFGLLVAVVAVVTAAVLARGRRR